MEIIHNRKILIRKLKEIFGFENFLNLDQETATTEIFAGDSDVYLGLQSGNRKSICFQLPTLLKKHNLTIIFLPTHSLAKRRVNFLKQKCINAEYLFSGMLEHKRQLVIEKLHSKKNEVQLLYTATDECTGNLVKDLLMTLNAEKVVSFVVFDEAHCISCLSPDYVPAYKKIAKLILPACKNIRKIAATGTATNEVKNDIINELCLTNVQEIFSQFQFPMYHDVYFIDSMSESPFENLKDFINKNLHLITNLYETAPKFGIIYCGRKRATEIVANELSKLGIPVVSYHEGLSLQKRTSISEKWLAGAIPVIAATPQFGVGLHRPNVRFIVHWSMPRSMHQLIQANGRICTDGKLSRSRVYYSLEEENNIMMFIKSRINKPDDGDDIALRKMKSYDELAKYCFRTTCRFVAQSACFGKKVSPCKYYCDACVELKSLKDRLQRFGRYRAKLKKMLINNLAFKQIQLSLVPNTSVILKNQASQNSTPTPAVRQLSYERLLNYLMKNYKVKDCKRERNIEGLNIPEIARHLEFSLRMSATSYKNYSNSVDQVIGVIKECTSSKFFCGYLRFHHADQDLFELSPERDVKMVVDENDTFNKNIKSSVICVNLVSDSSCDSDTP